MVEGYAQFALVSSSLFAVAGRSSIDVQLCSRRTRGDLSVRPRLQPAMQRSQTLAIQADCRAAANAYSTAYTVADGGLRTGQVDWAALMLARRLT